MIWAFTWFDSNSYSNSNSNTVKHCVQTSAKYFNEYSCIENTFYPGPGANVHTFRWVWINDRTRGFGWWLMIENGVLEEIKSEYLEQNSEQLLSEQWLSSTWREIEIKTLIDYERANSHSNLVIEYLVINASVRIILFDEFVLINWSTKTSLHCLMA